jgi:flagellin
MGKSLEKLSSGLRINRAGDDAAGLAISEKMRGQIRGLDQATRNAQDGISLIQTAEGALTETHSILQRMRELAVQSANDTNVSVDRSAIQDEIDQLTSEIDRIADTTEFNTRKLLNGSIGAKASDSGIVKNIETTGATKSGTYTVDASGATLATAASDVTAGAAAATDTVNGAGTITINGTDITVDATDTVQNVIDKINSNVDGVEASINSGGNFEIATTAVGAGETLDISATADGIVTADDAWNTTATSNTGTNISGVNVNGLGVDTGVAYVGNTVTVIDGTDDSAGLSVEVLDTQSVDITVSDSVQLQIGANEGQNMSVSINAMDAQSLGISSLNVGSSLDASEAITTINDAIETVSSARSGLGAAQNRLEHTINNLSVSSENLTAAESRIRDVDMAKEMMSFTRDQILLQSSNAMLAQANQLPQNVLSLLR